MIRHCNERADVWADEVRGRLQHCVDLFACDAVYHVDCYKRFLRGLPKTRGQVKLGRPVNDTANAAFLYACKQLEKSCESQMYTLRSVQSWMEDYVNGYECDDVAGFDVCDEDSDGDGSDSDDSDCETNSVKHIRQ